MNIDNLTLNLLKVFLAVYKHRSATVAAKELGQTNSAVSRALTNMRLIFEDELFLRTTGGFVPTERAVTLVKPIEKVVNTVKSFTGQFSNFDALTCETRFEIVTYDEFSYAVHKVIKKISSKAPRMRFNVRTLSYNCIPELLNGQVDFGVVYESFNDPRLEYKCFAKTENIYLLCRKGHPLTALKTFNTKDISEFPLLEIDNNQDLACPILVDLCRERNYSMAVGAYTESVAAAFRTLQETDFLAVMCNQFTREFADSVPSLTYIPLPAHLMKRVKELRSQVRPIGNYLVFGSTNQSPAFNWVKSELLTGLNDAWNDAMSTAAPIPQENYPASLFKP